MWTCASSVTGTCLGGSGAEGQSWEGGQETSQAALPSLDEPSSLPQQLPSLSAPSLAASFPHLALTIGASCPLQPQHKSRPLLPRGSSRAAQAALWHFVAAAEGLVPLGPLLWRCKAQVGLGRKFLGALWV